MSQDKECREAFEKWYGWLPLRQPGEYYYHSSSVNKDWDIWQAAWNARHESGVPSVALAKDDAVRELVKVLKDVHPHIAVDKLRHEAGDIIVKFDAQEKRHAD